MPRSRRPAALLTVIAAAAALFAVRRLARFAIAEESMAPALRAGDWVLAARLRRPPRRGEVVVFDHPHRPGFTLVKRVFGLPGERFALAGGSLVIDGGRVTEPWGQGPTTPDGEWGLGPDEVFVLGDNRGASADDSRVLGPIPVGALEWRVIGRYWPRR